MFRAKGRSIIIIIGNNTIGKIFQEQTKWAVRKYDIDGKTIDKTNFGFICLSMPHMGNGHPDISYLENIVRFLDAEIIVLCTTILPGTTDYLINKYGKKIVSLNLDVNSQICICGGDREVCWNVINLLTQNLNCVKVYRQASAKALELFDYMKNLHQAMNITFVDELYNLCQRIEVDMEELLELWAINHDELVSRGTRGIRDKTLTNDLTAMISFLEEIDLTSYLFEGISRANCFNLRRDYKENPASGKEIIKFYEIDQPYGYFSNFSHHPVYLKNKIWMTSEHYYQAQKFLDSIYQEKIRLTHSPVKAAKLGRDAKFPKRADWQEKKNDVMREVLYAKFTQHPDLTAKLLVTFPAVLVEHTANDFYWGDGGDGSGNNMLGKILMEIRNDLSHQNKND